MWIVISIICFFIGVGVGCIVMFKLVVFGLIKGIEDGSFKELLNEFNGGD